MEREKEKHLRRELLQGETIAWSGEPGPGAIFTVPDICMIPFGLFWCGFAVVWTTAMVSRDASLALGIFGCFFFAAGLYVAFGRFITRYIQDKNTIYAVTNRRILVVGKRSVSALELSNVWYIQKTERRSGSGSLDFTRPNKGLTTTTGTGWGFCGFGYLGIQPEQANDFFTY